MSNILNSTQFTENVDMTGAFTLTGSQTISANLSADGTATFAHLVVTDTISIPSIVASSITFDSSGVAYITHGDVQSAIEDLHDSMSHSSHTHAGLYAAIVHTHTAGSFTVTPHGGMTATTLQGALNYLEDHKSQTTHNHLGVYSPIGHNHSGIYELAGHLHTSIYSAIDHLHTGVYSLIDHNHDSDYSALTHAHTALEIAYDNTLSQLLTDNVQDAIDEIDTSIDDLYLQIDDASALYELVGHNHDSDYSALAHVHAALAITYDNATSGLVATNVQDAIDEIDTSIENIDLDAGSISYDSTATELESDNIEDIIDEIIERYDVVFHEGSDDVFVDSNRTDAYVENGSFNTPFKSIEDAVDYANEIVDETGSSSVTINCSPGTYEVENDIVCSGNIVILSPGIAEINLGGALFSFGNIEDLVDAPWKINDGNSALNHIHINNGSIINIRSTDMVDCNMSGCILFNMSTLICRNLVFTIKEDDPILLESGELSCAIGNFGGSLTFDNSDITICGEYIDDEDGLISYPAPIIQLQNIFGPVDATNCAMGIRDTTLNFSGDHNQSAMIRNSYGILGFSNSTIDIEFDSTNMNEIEFVGVVPNPNTKFSKVGYFNNMSLADDDFSTIICGDNPIIIEKCDFRKFNGTDIENKTGADYYEYYNEISGLSADNVQDAIDEVSLSVDSVISLNDSHVIYVSENWAGTIPSTGSVNAPYTTFDQAKYHIMNDVDVSLEEWYDMTTTLGSYTIILKDGTYSGDFGTIPQYSYDLTIRGEGDVTLDSFIFSCGGDIDIIEGTISYSDTYTLTRLENLNLVDCALIMVSDKSTIKNCKFTNCAIAIVDTTVIYNSTFYMNSEAVVYDMLSIDTGIINLSHATFNNCEFYKDELPSNGLLVQASLGGDLVCSSYTKCRFINCTYVSSDVDDTLSTINIAGGGFDSMGSFYSGNYASPLVVINNTDVQSDYDNYVGNNVFVNDGAGVGCYVTAADLNSTYLVSGNVGVTFQDQSDLHLQAAGSVEHVIHSSVEHSTTSPAGDIEAIFDQYHTLPADFARLINVFKFSASYNIINDNAADTLTIRVRVGGLTGEIVLETNAYNATAGDSGVIFITAIPHVLGALGHFHILYSYSQTKSGVNTMTGGSDTIDMNTLIANDLVVTYEWSNSHVDNQVYLSSYLLEAF